MAGADAGRVLVVDDDEDLRDLVRTCLEAGGFDVVCAASGADGLLRFSEDPECVVLMDILMPALDGFETLEKLRALPGGPDASVVILTALGDEGTQARALEAGADDFLHKPISPMELLARTRSTASLGRARRELRRAYAGGRGERVTSERTRKGQADLIAMMVHDFKNPLTVIRLGAESVMETLPEDEEGRRTLLEVTTAADQLKLMVANLLDIARGEDGELRPRLAAIALHDLSGEVLQALRGSAELENVSLSLLPGAAPATIRGDRDLIRRVLANLVDNAIAHSPSGGKVIVSVTALGDAVEMSVRDEGAGVPPEQLERIFEKYVQEGPDAERRINRGLGLTFCKMAVGAHGGTLSVRPTGHRGADFVVSLPKDGPSEG